MNDPLGRNRCRWLKNSPAWDVISTCLITTYLHEQNRPSKQKHLDQVESGGTPGESKELRNAREKFTRVFGVSLGEEDRLVSGACSRQT